MYSRSWMHYARGELALCKPDFALCNVHFALSTYFAIHFCPIGLTSTLPNALCTIQFVLSILCCPLYAIHFALCKFALCTSHHQLCVIHFVLYTLHHPLCAIHITLSTFHFEILRFARCTIQFALSILRYALCTVEGGVSVQGRYCIKGTETALLPHEISSLADHHPDEDHGGECNHFRCKDHSEDDWYKNHGEEGDEDDVDVYCDAVF